MIQREHNGAMVAGVTEEAVDRFIANDDKIRAGQCPNNCGPLVIETHGIGLQVCGVCNFSTNTRRDEIHTETSDFGTREL